MRNRSFCQPDEISITLLYPDNVTTDTHIYSSLFVAKTHERYSYSSNRKKGLLYLLLIICGDVETCPGPDHQDTNASLKDLLRGNGLKIFHQNICGLYQNLEKVTAFLHQHKNVHIFSLSETHINDSTLTQIFEIPGYSFIHKNRGIGSHGGVGAYIHDSIPFKRRTDLETV